VEGEHEPVFLESAKNVVDADIVAAALHAAGIPVYVPGAALSDEVAAAKKTYGAVGTEIYVARRDVAVARSIVDRLRSGAAGRDAWICKACGESHEAQFGVCWRCDAPRDDDATDGSTRSLEGEAGAAAALSAERTSSPPPTRPADERTKSRAAGELVVALVVSEAIARVVHPLVDAWMVAHLGALLGSRKNFDASFLACAAAAALPYALFMRGPTAEARIGLRKRCSVEEAIVAAFEGFAAFAATLFFICLGAGSEISIEDAHGFRAFPPRMVVARSIALSVCAPAILSALERLNDHTIVAVAVFAAGTGVATAAAVDAPARLFSFVAAAGVAAFLSVRFVRRRSVWPAWIAAGTFWSMVQSMPTRK
jgi:hypothetical protein